MLVDIVNEQSKTHKVHIVIINQTKNDSLFEKISKRVTTHKIERHPGSRNIFKLVFANIFLIRLNPDVVHCHNQDLASFFPFARWLHKKLFLTVHGIGVPSNNFSKYDKLFAISDSVKKDIQTRTNLLPETVFNGIKIRLKQKNKYYSNLYFTVIQIGRLDHYVKGQDILLKAVAYLVYSKNIRDISVAFVGEGPSGEYLKKLATNLKIKEFCIFHGVKTREWIYHNLREYDLFVQPSRYEPFGLTVAEAIAAKVPVLVSNVDGPMEITDNGKYGFFFNKEDDHDLGRQIIKIRKEYGSEEFMKKIDMGYRHVVKSYDIQQTAEKYLCHYMKRL
jgi:glycosyltransferase involved in cell wall biosynthesis